MRRWGIIFTGSWEIESEMEVCRLEFYREMSSGTTPVQEGKPLELGRLFRVKAEPLYSALTGPWIQVIPWEKPSLWPRAVSGERLGCDLSPVNFPTAAETRSGFTLKQDLGSTYPIHYRSRLLDNK